MNRKIKTEHSDAKNGGGFWGKRAAAKKVSKKLRRTGSKKVTKYFKGLFKKVLIFYSLLQLFL